MTLRRRALISAAALSLPAGFAAAAPGWPRRPVRLVVPFAAGGGTDILARTMVDALRPALPHPIIVENRPGEGGVTGAAFVAQAEPDGHTLVMVVSTHVMNRYCLRAIPFDPVTGFSPIAMLTRNTLVLAAGVDQPFATLPDMLFHAEAHPGAVGTGSTEPLTAFIGQELARRTGVEMPDVPCHSGHDLMRRIVAGSLPVGWTSTVSAAPHLATGRVRLLSVSTGLRSSFLPEVPTAIEQGIAEFDIAGWVALLGPPGMDEGLVREIGTTMRELFRDESFLMKLHALGVERDFRLAPQLLSAMRRDDRLWAAAAGSGRIRPQL